MIELVNILNKQIQIQIQIEIHDIKIIIFFIYFISIKLDQWIVI